MGYRCGAAKPQPEMTIKMKDVHGAFDLDQKRLGELIGYCSLDPEQVFLP
jgi:hypothetical protein